MKFHGIAWGLCLFLGFDAAGVPVQSGSQLTISFKLKDNNNLLRNKLASEGYAVVEDGYAVTLWIEGPYDTATSCQTQNFERQNIKLAKILHWYQSPTSRHCANLCQAINPWRYPDYRTPDLAAAVMVSGVYNYCTSPSSPGFVSPAGSTTSTCNTSAVAPVSSRRQNPTTGGIWCGSPSVMCNPIVEGTYPYVPLGDISKLTDGTTGATIYPALNPNPKVYTWDMKNGSGVLIEQGFYVVYVQMSAERYPVYYETGRVVNGVDQVDLETCWDNPYYDTLGHHRVVELFEFKGTSMSRVVTKEKKYKADLFNYMDGNMTFNYTTPAGAEAYPGQAAAKTLLIAPNPSRASSTLYFPGNGAAPEGTPVKIFGIHGKLWREETGYGRAMPLNTSGWPAGLYVARARMGGLRLSKTFAVTR